MAHNDPLHHLKTLAKELDGELFTDTATRIMHATDASAYREIPVAVARPGSREDIRRLIAFTRRHTIPLIPRTAGTSLAGQVVGPGMVVDVSRHLNRILEINEAERWIRVEPGVILDELNQAVAPHGLFFGPETSTSSRCMIGGMVGNNSCGAHSIIYGSTRDHVISLKVFLSDGTEAEFTNLSPDGFNEKLQAENLEGKIYRQIENILNHPRNRENITREYPDPAIHRRNTGYALDLLLQTRPFCHSSLVARYPLNGTSIPDFNFSKLICGSEGTLAFITEIKLNLVPLPPREKALVCVHCSGVQEALQANLIALRYKPGSVELMDKAILDCTRENITQRKNRFFIEGDPGAILIVEFARPTREEILETASRMENEMRGSGFGYAFPLIFPPEMNRVWALRKAGVGVLSNYPGDKKPVAVTEDTAVTPEMLPAYIEEFSGLMERLGLNCVYHAHVGSGELHLRPVLDLKDPHDVELFHTVALETAKLVKKYRGSLSGEHGDGRLRGEFIPLMIGEENYRLLKEIKQLWDPQGILNPGKITDTPKMNAFLRYDPGSRVREIRTVFGFHDSQGILRATEQCNGSGECRNTHLTGRGMCPSYMASLDEHTTTRARANILREFLTRSENHNPFDHPEIYDVMDLCLSCKACKAECPSNVDMARLKAEFLQHWYDSNGIPLRTRLIAGITTINKLGMLVPPLFNFFMTNSLIRSLLHRTLGFSRRRSLPLLHRITLRRWCRDHLDDLNPALTMMTGRLFLFIDEFTDYNDVETGIAFIRLMNRLGYRVEVIPHGESGRTYLSKGMVRKARKIAIRNIRTFAGCISGEAPLVGIEPSAILGFRDEYPDLVDGRDSDAARKLSADVLLFDEFIVREAENGRIRPDQFTGRPACIKLHGHCHQKTLASVEASVKMLSLPVNYRVTEIPSGCCGMAGSFGYEKEHYDLSMKVGELVLFPEIRSTDAEVIIAAPGTSCRQQIKHGTGRTAFHPVEILYHALD
jgi:FAD/FMN-containing dehydrogenase/Fe-S oxidoreductase